MRPGGAGALLEKAHHRVQAALQGWKPTDMHRIAETRDLLQQSVFDLKTAIELLRCETSDVNQDFQPRIVSLRRDITSMISLVDACASFHRGLALRRGASTPVYNASGQTVGECESGPSEEVVG